MSDKHECNCNGNCKNQNPGACAHENPAANAAEAAQAGENTGGGREKSEVEVLRDQLKRAFADFDNYRKLVSRNREEECALAEAGLVEDLLPVLDEFDAALNSLEEGEHKKGVQMVHDNFYKILVSRGLRPIESVGKKFDSSVHEAVKSVALQEGQEDGAIVEQLRAGFEFNGKILRHPLVAVAKKQ